MLISNDNSKDDTEPGVLSPRERAEEYARTLRAGSLVTEKDRDGLGDAGVYLLGALRSRGLHLELAPGEGWFVRRSRRA